MAVKGPGVLQTLAASANRDMEWQRLALPIDFHLPVGPRPLDRIAKQENQFHPGIVRANALQRRGPEQVDRRCLVGFPVRTFIAEGTVEELIVRLAPIERLIVKEMKFLGSKGWQQVWMGLKVAKQAGGSGLLNAANDYLNPLSEHCILCRGSHRGRADPAISNG